MYRKLEDMLNISIKRYDNPTVFNNSHSAGYIVSILPNLYEEDGIFVSKDSILAKYNGKLARVIVYTPNKRDRWEYISTIKTFDESLDKESLIPTKPLYLNSVVYIPKQEYSKAYIRKYYVMPNNISKIMAIPGALMVQNYDNPF